MGASRGGWRFGWAGGASQAIRQARRGAAVAVRIVRCYVVRMNVRTNLLLPEDLVREVDRFAGPRNRSRYVAEALEARLRHDRLREAVVATAGTWRDRDRWGTSEKVVDWLRELRAETTDPGPDAP
jgi:predicted transcriptional regulator